MKLIAMTAALALMAGSAMANPFTTGNEVNQAGAVAPNGCEWVQGENTNALVLIGTCNTAAAGGEEDYGRPAPERDDPCGENA